MVAVRSHEAAVTSPWLNYPAAFVWATLREHDRPMSSAQLAGLLGWMPWTVSRLLRRLKRAGFAERSGRRWRWSGDYLASLRVYASGGAG